MGYGIFGYIEVRDQTDRDWSVYKELETGDIPRGSVTQLVFGSGSKANCASLFEDRGLPLDATEAVRDDYMNTQRIESPQMDKGWYRDMFGHSHVYASELPQFVLNRFGPFADAAEEHDNARLLVWFNR
jgi:hypothetical protein